MGHLGWVGLLALTTAAGKRAQPRPGRSAGAVGLAGEYALARVGDRPLPSRPFPGRVTVFSDRLRLLADGRYTQTWREQVCTPAAPCFIRTHAVRGTWEVVPGDTVRFRPARGTGWVARAEGAGRRLVGPSVAGPTPGEFVYERP